jgi:hypothetical protein
LNKNLKYLLVLLAAICSFVTQMYLIALEDTTQPSYACVGAYMFLGFAYSIFTSVFWASVPFLVKGRTLVTAFGVCSALINIGNSFIPVIVGHIRHNTKTDHGYFWVNKI